MTLEPTCRVEFGAGAVTDLPRFVTDLGHQRALVVTDKGLQAAGIAPRVGKILDAAGIEHEIHDDISANPSAAEIDRGAARARAFGPSVVVALGGGSPLDAAKGIALLAGNPGATAADADRLWEAADGLPVIAVPTTSGTGAETNGFGVIEDTHARRKVYIGHSSVRPRIAVLDPELTLGLPARATAATGVDALVHGTESLASLGATPMSVAYAQQAVTLVARWLPVAHRDGTDLEARAQLMWGAHLAGQALTLSGLGLVHGIGHAITAHTGTPHGIALAAVFEEVIAFNAAAAAAAHEQTARALAAPGGDGTAATLAAVRELSGPLEIRKPLRHLGVERDMLPDLARAAVQDPVTRNNPRTPSAAEVLELLGGVY
ncbi:alcohol dehydrogenase class IV [Amycolatopsis endophytica]|uniref:Alcohol dehydrogenase class IV n=1 Tax=Amycolatopsis endophytica TaxID=860233 RepID=A0A853B9V4_9PSEU|nr:iron-containing alcohol dehydrogenase [Amycolatopsis endophytica]NYI91554.1 alcohol dehydrogenase class IV [Amycolatopsis endophytica]